MGEKCIHLPVVGYIYFREREREREREFPQHVAVYGFSLYISERCPFCLVSYVKKVSIYLWLDIYIFQRERERERERERYVYV